MWFMRNLSLSGCVPSCVGRRRSGSNIKGATWKTDYISIFFVCLIRFYILKNVTVVTLLKYLHSSYPYKVSFKYLFTLNTHILIINRFAFVEMSWYNICQIIFIIFFIMYAIPFFSYSHPTKIIFLLEVYLFELYGQTVSSFYCSAAWLESLYDSAILPPGTSRGSSQLVPHSHTRLPRHHEACFWAAAARTTCNTPTHCLWFSAYLCPPPLPWQLCPIIVIKKKRKLDSDFPHVLTSCAASSPLKATCLCMQYARRGPPLPGAEFTYWFLTEIIFTIPLQYLNNLHLHPSPFACWAAPRVQMWGVVIGGCTISWHCCGWHFSILCFGIIAFYPPSTCAH